MGLFNFFNYFSQSIGMFLGSIVIHIEHIKSGNYKKVCFLILLHAVFILASFILLFISKIPEKPEEYPDFHHKSMMLEKSFDQNFKLNVSCEIDYIGEEKNN